MDDLNGFEIGACAVIDPGLTATASVQRTIGDSNVAEFGYKKTVLDVSLGYKF